MRKLSTIKISQIISQDQKHFLEKNPIFSRSDWINRLDLDSKKSESRKYIFFQNSDIFRRVLEAALDNYSLYRCSTLSSTAEESITRRLRVTHAPHPDDDDYPYLSLYSSDFYLNQTQKIKKKSFHRNFILPSVLKD